MAKKDISALSKTLATDETTPLLIDGASPVPLTDDDEISVVAGDSSRVDDDKPLPKGQILLLCYLRLVEPIAFFAVFPFINKMISEIGSIKEEDVGFYSGLIVRQDSVIVVFVIVTERISGVALLSSTDVLDDSLGQSR
jgi:hypothetical protein